jgi:hypothetical protein
VVKKGENYQQQQEKAQDTSWKKGQSRDEIIYNDSNLKPRETKKVGDYVDYEELD